MTPRKKSVNAIGYVPPMRRSTYPTTRESGSNILYEQLPCRHWRNVEHHNAQKRYNPERPDDFCHHGCHEKGEA